MMVVAHIHVNGVDLEYVDAGTVSPSCSHTAAARTCGTGSPSGRSSPAATGSSLTAIGSTEPVLACDGGVLGRCALGDLVAIMRALDSGPVHLVGFSSAIALRATLAEPGLVRSLTIVEPNVPWLLEGDPEGETVLAWWREENERVRAEAAGDVERGATLWFELVNNRGPGTFQAQPEDSAGCGSTTSARDDPRRHRRNR